MKKVLITMICVLIAVSAAHAWQRGSGFNQGDLEMAGYSINGDPETGLLFDSDSDGVDEVVIDALGNVGIGTTAPGAALEVAGTVMARNVTATGGGTNLLENQTILNDLGSTAPGNVLRIEAGGNENAVTVNRENGNVIIAGGNVGIGATDPSSKMELVGNLRITGNLRYMNSNPVIFTDGYSSTLDVDAQHVALQSNNVAGNVGIRTNIPGAALDVNSSVSRWRSPDGSISECGPDNSDNWSCNGI